MTKDQNSPRLWHLEQTPARASVWPYLVGHLVSYGHSHYHSFPDYYCPHIITKGRGTIRLATGETDVKTGDMFTLWPGVEIEYFDRRDEPWEFYYFHIEGPEMEAFVKACGFRSDRIVIRPREPDHVTQLFGNMYQMITSQKSGDEFRILSQLYQLPACCISQPSNESRDRHEELLANAMTLIATQLATGINVNELCAKLGISRVTLFRLFQNKLGETPVSYIGRKRINKAKELLRTTHSPLSTIAALSGFQSEKYFIRRFGECEGVTPGEFRRKAMLTS